MKNQINKTEATAYITKLYMKYGNINQNTDIDLLSSQLELMINELSAADYDNCFYANGGHFPTLKKLINKYFKNFILDLRKNQNKIIELIEVEYPNTLKKKEELEKDGWTEDNIIKFKNDFEERIFQSSKKGFKNKKWYQEGKSLLQNFNNIQKTIKKYQEYICQI